MPWFGSPLIQACTCDVRLTDTHCIAVGCAGIDASTVASISSPIRSQSASASVQSPVSRCTCTLPCGCAVATKNHAVADTTWLPAAIAERS